jgi:hypothetical protein
MKIYSLPDELPAPQPDYSKYDYQKERAAEDKHIADLKAWLLNHGYDGKYTGEIYKEGVADGYALYMVADGRKFALIHLPYGDGYESRDVAYLPKREIIRRIEARKELRAMFKSQGQP